MRSKKVVCCLKASPCSRGLTAVMKQWTLPSVTWKHFLPGSRVLCWPLKFSVISVDLWTTALWLLWPLQAILGSLSRLHHSAVGFMWTVPAGALITFLTCTLNQYESHQSPGAAQGDQSSSLQSVREGEWLTLTDIWGCGWSYVCSGKLLCWKCE